MAGGARSRADGVLVSARRRPDPELPTRLGLSARAPSAVKRNLVKRRLRAASRECLPPRGWDVVIATDPSVAAHCYQELEKSVSRAVAGATR